MLSGVIGLIGAITGAVAAVTGIAFGWWNAGRERQARVALAQAGQEHERQMAQDERIYSSRKAVYEKMLHAVGSILLYLEFAIPSADQGRLKNYILNPTLGVQPIPMPDAPSLVKLAARVAASGSEMVLQKVEEVIRAAANMFSEAQAARQEWWLDDEDPSIRSLGMKAVGQFFIEWMFSDDLVYLHKTLDSVPGYHDWEREHKFTIESAYKWSQREVTLDGWDLQWRARSLMFNNEDRRHELEAIIERRTASQERIESAIHDAIFNMVESRIGHDKGNELRQELNETGRRNAEARSFLERFFDGKYDQLISQRTALEEKVRLIQERVRYELEVPWSTIDSRFEKVESAQ